MTASKELYYHRIQFPLTALKIFSDEQLYRSNRARNRRPDIMFAAFVIWHWHAKELRVYIRYVCFAALVMWSNKTMQQMKGLVGIYLPFLSHWRHEFVLMLSIIFFSELPRYIFWFVGSVILFWTEKTPKVKAVWPNVRIKVAKFLQNDVPKSSQDSFT